MCYEKTASYNKLTVYYLANSGDTNAIHINRLALNIMSKHAHRNISSRLSKQQTTNTN